MKLYFVAGERSGDLHAAQVIRALKAQDSSIRFRGFGGDEMRTAGMNLVVHYREMSFMGFLEVLKNYNTIKQYIADCKADILDFKPDAIVLVDYGGFNMKIAKFAAENKIKVFYYIPPKVWAWNTKRVQKIKKYVNHVLSILPFELDFYKKHNVHADYVGNPSYDEIRRFTPNPNFKRDNEIGEKPVFALLPGSRKDEVKYILETMLKVAAPYADRFQILVAGVHSIPKDLYAVCEKYPVKIIYEKSFDLLTVAHKALVTSGTASLETCLFDVPQIVCYQSSWISGKIGRMVMKVKWASLVNLIANREVVRELMIEDFTEKKLSAETKMLLEDEKYVAEIKKGYKEVKDQLNKPNAGKNTADKILQYLS